MQKHKHHKIKHTKQHIFSQALGKTKPRTPKPQTLKNKHTQPLTPKTQKLSGSIGNRNAQAGFFWKIVSGLMFLIFWGLFSRNFKTFCRGCWFFSSFQDRVVSCFLGLSFPEATDNFLFLCFRCFWLCFFGCFLGLFFFVFCDCFFTP